MDSIILDLGTFYLEVVEPSLNHPVVCIFGTGSKSLREYCKSLVKRLNSPRLAYAYIKDMNLGVDPPCTVVFYDGALKEAVPGAPTMVLLKTLLEKKKSDFVRRT